MVRAGSLRRSLWWCAAAFACVPPAAAPRAPEPARQETLSVTARAPSAPAPEASELVTAPPPGELECVRPLDPELEQESPWGRAVAARVDRALSRLGRCADGIAAGEQAFVTLRLVYAQDGAPRSQHVVHGSPNACAAAACLMRELAAVRAPKLLVEEAAHDVALVLERGAAPERAEGPPEVLAIDDAPPAVDDGASEGASGEASCIDPQVAQLSRKRVREIVGGTYDELKVCYAQALVRNHSASGNVTFEFIIDRDGAVALAEARSATLYDCEAIRCMLQQFRALSFPPPVGRSVRVIYPINYVIEQPPVSLR